MPIYDYECGACGHRFDALQSAGTAPLRKCPECGRARLQKCASAPSFQLKGGGWRKPAARPSTPKRRTVGHTLDSGPAHSHDDQAPESGGHGHHGGHGHSHGPGHKHHQH